MQWLNTSPFTKNVPERLDWLIAAGHDPARHRRLRRRLDVAGRQPVDQLRGHRPLPRLRGARPGDLGRPHLPHRGQGHVAGAGGQVVGGLRGAGDLAASTPTSSATSASTRATRASSTATCTSCRRRRGPLLKAGGVEAWYRDFLERAMATKMNGEDHTVINMLCMAAAYSPKRGRAAEPRAAHRAAVRAPAHRRVEPMAGARPGALRAQAPRRVPQAAGASSSTAARATSSTCAGARGMISEELKAASIEHVHEEFEDGHMGVNYRFERSLCVAGAPARPVNDPPTWQ